MSEVVTGVGEFDFDVLEELLGIGVGDVVEMTFGEVFGVATTAFRCVKVPNSVELNRNAEAIGRRLRQPLLDIAIGIARGNPIVDLV